MQPMPKPLLLSMQSVFPHVAMPRPRVAFSRLPVQPDIEGWLIASSASLTMQHQALRKWRLLVRCSSALRTKGGFGRPDAKPTPLRCAISSMVWLDSSCTDADRKVLALQRLYLFSDNSDVDPADACDLKDHPSRIHVSQQQDPKLGMWSLFATCLNAAGCQCWQNP